MNRAWVVAVFITGLLFMPVLSFADEVDLPFALKIDPFIADCLSHGLDLRDGDNADGFVRNEGTTVKVFTYRKIEIKELDLIKEAAWRNLRNHKKV